MIAGDGLLSTIEPRLGSESFLSARLLTGPTSLSVYVSIVSAGIPELGDY
jgi:hypothetical protein